MIIGIDAGGTKTKGYLFDHESIKKEFIGGAGSPAVTKFAFKNIQLVIEQLITKDVEQIIIGVSGIGVIADVSKWEEFFFKKYNLKTKIISDAAMALYSLMKTSVLPSIVAIAGTGSSVFASSGGQAILIGGYGHMLRERGSSYALVKSLALRMIDKFEQGIKLSNFECLFLKKLNYVSVQSFKEFFYNNSKSEIASYAKFICDNSFEEDVLDLIREEASSLSTQIIIAKKRLNLPNDAFLALKGGLFSNAIYKNELINYLKNTGNSFNIVEYNEDVLFGAIYYQYHEEEEILC